MTMIFACLEVITIHTVYIYSYTRIPSFVSKCDTLQLFLWLHWFRSLENSALTSIQTVNTRARLSLGKADRSLPVATFNLLLVNMIRRSPDYKFFSF